MANANDGLREQDKSKTANACQAKASVTHCLHLTCCGKVVEIPWQWDAPLQHVWAIVQSCHVLLDPTVQWCQKNSMLNNIKIWRWTFEIFKKRTTTLSISSLPNVSSIHRNLVTKQTLPSPKNRPLPATLHPCVVALCAGAAVTCAVAALVVSVSVVLRQDENWEESTTWAPVSSYK